MVVRTHGKNGGRLKRPYVVASGREEFEAIREAYRELGSPAVYSWTFDTPEKAWDLARAIEAEVRQRRKL